MAWPDAFVSVKIQIESGLAKTTLAKVVMHLNIKRRKRPNLRC